MTKHMMEGVSIFTICLYVATMNRFKAMKTIIKFVIHLDFAMSGGYHQYLPSQCYILVEYAIMCFLICIIITLLLFIDHFVSLYS